MSFTTVADRAIGEFETPCATAHPFFTDLVQLMVLSSSLDPYQAPAVRETLEMKLSDEFFEPAATPRPDEQRPQNLLRGMLKALVEATNRLCLFGPLISPILEKHYWCVLEAL